MKLVFECRKNSACWTEFCEYVDIKAGAFIMVCNIANSLYLIQIATPIRHQLNSYVT